MRVYRGAKRKVSGVKLEEDKLGLKGQKKQRKNTADYFGYILLA